MEGLGHMAKGKREYGRVRGDSGYHRRILVVMVDAWGYWAATSGRDQFIMVLEKNVSTSITARNAMAIFFIISFLVVVFFMFCPFLTYPFTLPE